MEVAGIERREVPVRKLHDLTSNTVRIELELQKEDMFMEHLQENVNAGYLATGHRVA